jgi:uncharacterized membrane protein
MVSDITEGQAVALSVGLLVGGFFVYDLVMLYTPVQKSDLAATAVFFPLIVALSYGLTHVLSGRASYIQLGAMFGTIMVSNVWIRILPGQRRMLEQRHAGQEPDMSEGARGKQRSKHNTYMSVPLIFLMVSNHFPVGTYGNEYNWLILSGLVAMGWVGAKLIRSH